VHAWYGLSSGVVVWAAGYIMLSEGELHKPIGKYDTKILPGTSAPTAVTEQAAEPPRGELVGVARLSLRSGRHVVGSENSNEGLQDARARREVFENREPRGIAQEFVERKGRAPLTHVPYIRLTREPADLGNFG
jgi:hypothetical protein